MSILASNNCFSHRHVFQNGVKTISKIVLYCKKYCTLRNRYAEIVLLFHEIEHVRQKDAYEVLAC